MEELLENVIRSMVEELQDFHKDDAEMLEFSKPRKRAPATPEQLRKLENLWGRAIPPSYRKFLEVTNGLDKFQGTHTLLGTEDFFDTWAAEQIKYKAEFWDDFELDQSIILCIAEADSGIHNLWTFDKSDKEEMVVVDWDQGERYDTFETFEAFLRDELE